MKKLFFTLEILLLCFYFCQAQYVLKGRIMDEISFKPIENVYLTIDKAKTGTLSSSTGYFEIYIEKLPATITFSHVTYEKKLVKLSEEDFSANNEKIINIELSAKAIETKMVDIVEHRFGKMLDTTPKVDYIGFTITKQGFIYALVKRQDNTYLRIYNLEDSVLSEKKVEKKLSQIWSFKGDIYIGSDLNLNKNYDDITKTYQI